MSREKHELKIGFRRLASQQVQSRRQNKAGRTQSVASLWHGQGDCSNHTSSTVYDSYLPVLFSREARSCQTTQPLRILMNV